LPRMSEGDPNDRDSSGLRPEDEERLREAFDSVPFAHLLGIELGEMRLGEATLHLSVRDELLQNNGVVHGGVLASLMDSAAAFAILTLLEKGQTTTTVDLTVHYLRPLVRGRVTAKARVVRAGRRVLVITIDVLDETEALAATALTSFIRLS
ncbi:MAG TPA: PaaI family thioesterase, partial [Pyrinomonadaceae bacterium]|nr:PaaI family thioesterase [Pyrinomonadaceae bacterium]